MAFVDGWRTDGALAAAAYDIKTDAPSEAVRRGKWDDYARADVGGRAAIGDALNGAAVVFSTVTADQALVAARNAAPCLERETLYLDCNSCAPDTKRMAARLIEDAGGRYVDIAVMTSVKPALHKTPLLVSGPHAEAALAVLDLLDMSARIVQGAIGAASSIKMIRSVMVKGLEALVLECVLAGRKAGVADAVLDSLEATYPGFDWRKRAAYMLERVATHGVRRAAEMREVADTIAALGLSDAMSRASVEWQQRVGALDLSLAAPGTDDLDRLADAILAALEATETSDTHEAAE